ncbi:MAG: membrane biogenesis protein [Actinobacteria bacterium]|nr:membrane biogenesis protein [Actinomycetota bacterium]
MPTTPFRATFTQPIPVFAMLHLKGETPTERQDRARREIDLLWRSGVDAVIVENYFGTVDDVVWALDHLRAERPDVRVGLNVLNDDWRGFELARAYGVAFLQLDSVAGHLTPDDDAAFAERINAERARTDALVFGGVRFKYQPYLSGRTLAEDLVLGAGRCDAIVVTGEGTGLVTPTEKVAEFRAVVGPEFPLVVGAGVTAENADAQLTGADGVIVGSALKDTFVDTGDVSAEHAAAFVNAVRSLPGRADRGVSEGVRA